jgi:hypothetical protein
MKGRKHGRTGVLGKPPRAGASSLCTPPGLHIADTQDAGGSQPAVELHSGLD